jgi:hypothetical protein
MDSAVSSAGHTTEELGVLYIPFQGRLEGKGGWRGLQGIAILQ